jgi:hypothetical protein
MEVTLATVRSLGSDPEDFTDDPAGLFQGEVAGDHRVFIGIEGDVFAPHFKHIGGSEMQDGFHNGKVGANWPQQWV